MNRLKKRLAAIASAVLMCAALVGVTAPQASAASGTITGTVDCFYGNNNVSGVWVNVTNGTDGWATLSGSGSHKSYSFKMSQASTYRLHVGCGGSSSSWGATMYTPTGLNGQSYSWVCSYSNSQGFFCAMS